MIGEVGNELEKKVSGKRIKFRATFQYSGKQTLTGFGTLSKRHNGLHHYVSLIEMIENMKRPI